LATQIRKKDCTCSFYEDNENLPLNKRVKHNHDSKEWKKFEDWHGIGVLEDGDGITCICEMGDCADCQRLCGHDILIEEELTQYGQGVCENCLKHIPKKYLSSEELELLNSELII
jgi:hypothetical protein